MKTLVAGYETVTGALPSILYWNSLIGLYSGLVVLRLVVHCMSAPFLTAVVVTFVRPYGTSVAYVNGFVVVTVDVPFAFVAVSVTYVSGLLLLNVLKFSTRALLFVRYVTPAVLFVRYVCPFTPVKGRIAFIVQETLNEYPAARVNVTLLIIEGVAGPTEEAVLNPLILRASI
jgi:hypothetical protein